MHEISWLHFNALCEQVISYLKIHGISIKVDTFKNISL